MPRLNILKEKDIRLFDSPPKFSTEDRTLYFTLPDSQMIFRKIETKIGYILQEGYFKSRQKFFLPSQYHEDDIEYVTKLCEVKRFINIGITYNRFTYNLHKQIILEKFEYRPFSESKLLFEKETFKLVRSSLKPEEIFYTLLELLNARKIEIPKYYIFAETITRALNLFENKLIKVVDSTLTTEQKDILNEFMYLSVDMNREPSPQNPYLITHLKKAEQTITPAKIKESLKDFEYIKDLYEILSTFFTSNPIPNELINYYTQSYLYQTLFRKYRMVQYRTYKCNIPH